MKILAVGYACSPAGGSEAGIGWDAVCRIAKHHDVWVLTDIRNHHAWEIGRAEGKIPNNVQVRFLRKFSPWHKNRFIARIQSWLNYWSFNRIVLDAATEWHREISFDLCHQVTIAAWRMPSPLHQLPIPFLWGPIGGAGYIPPEFRGILSFGARQFERARDWQTAIALRSPSFHQCIGNTAVVFVANAETEELLRPFRKDRPMLRLPSGSVSSEKFEAFRRPRNSALMEGPLRLFAGGNIEGRKGVSLALKALALVKAAGVHFHYIVAGGGPEISSLRRLSQQLNLQEEVTFHPGFSGAGYIHALQQSDVYLLPSFRETTPVTLLEAYIAGCYPIVADTSAQGEIVRLVGGHAVPLTSMQGLIDGLAQAVIWGARHREELLPLTRAAADRISDHFSSERFDATMAHGYELAVRGLAEK